MNRSRILSARPCYTPRRLTDASTGGRTAVLVMLEDGTVGEVFAFFADEMPIAVNEVIGLTVAGAGAFYRRCVQADVELPDGQHPQPKAAARTLDIIATLPQRWRTRALCDVLPRGHLVGLAAALDLAKDLGEVSQIAAWRTLAAHLTDPLLEQRWFALIAAEYMPRRHMLVHASKAIADLSPFGGG